MKITSINYTRNFWVYVEPFKVETLGGRGTPYEVTSISVTVHEDGEIDAEFHGYRMVADGSRRAVNAAGGIITGMDYEQRQELTRELIRKLDLGQEVSL